MKSEINEILYNAGVQDRRITIKEMTEKEAFFCNLCGKSFKSKKEYDAHNDGRNSDKSYYCLALKEETNDEEEEEEENVDEVSKLKEQIKKLKAEIKELKDGKKEKKKDDSEENDEENDENADDKMARLRAMKKK